MLGSKKALEISIRGEERQAAEARHALDSLQDHVPEDLLDQARFLANELVTNSIQHGCNGSECHVHIRAEGSPRSVRVEVSDTGPGFVLPDHQLPDLDGEHGRGLFLVDQIATRWGVERNSQMMVWFELLA